MTGNSNMLAGVGNPVRLAALEATALLDSPAEECFDRYTRLATAALEVPVSLISLVDSHRQFFKSQVGLPEPWASCRETSLSHSFCQHVVADNKPLIVEDARFDPRLCDNLALRDLSVVAYLGIPLTGAQGQVLGSFCAIDSKPRRWSSREIGILKDLAAGIGGEIELRGLTRQVLKDHERLQSLEVQRDELVHLLVHDLRNPLGSLLAGLEVMGSIGDTRSLPGDFLSATRGSGEALLRMINEILDVSRSETEGLALTPVSLQPATLVAKACRQIEHLARLKQIALQRELAPGLPTLQGDAEKLQRVLVNLLTNAIQHTRGGGQVTVRAEPGHGDTVRLTVSDTGHGISREAIGGLFEKFAQCQNRNLWRSSSGLGLYFCKLVVEAHGGRIGADSAPDRGATFWFDLPLIPLAEATD